MRLLGRYQGRNGAIEIVECSADGTRIYFEEGVRQSQATPDGESVFSYVRLMDELLHRATNILVLGCGGGNLATRLARLGKDLTIVPRPPTPGSPERRCPDMSKTAALTGYSGRVSLDEGLQRTYDWYLRNVFEATRSTSV